jgi:two-component system chemotaxis response regulator CheY
MRSILSNYLWSAGWEVVTAKDGEAGLSAWAAAAQAGEPFTVVVTDIEMPVMDGISFIRQLRARSDGSSVPIVVASRVTDPRVRERALDAGASEYHIKLDRAELIEAVGRRAGDGRRAA